jgi:hypothetical protein
MKSIKLSLYVIVIFTLTQGQTHLIYVNYGASVPITTSVLGYSYSANDKTIEFIKSTYSKGNVIRGGVSYYLFNNIGFDCSVSYLMGKQEETIHSDRNEISKYNSRNLSITPSLILKSDIGSISPYLKCGISINYIDLNIIRDLSINSKVVIEEEYKNDYGLGVSSAVGVIFLYNSYANIFAEAQFNNLTFYPSEVKYYKNDILIKTTYPKDKLESQYGSYSTSDAISAFPFSNITFCVGIAIQL